MAEISGWLLMVSIVVVGGLQFHEGVHGIGEGLLGSDALEYVFGVGQVHIFLLFIKVNDQ